ncbi:MAG: DUF1501 domain-containing protein, partial [Armatimonadetes bacterium]|nr:DUF1501 domain-containing protein [Armatimonadota bacterium]
MLDHDSGTALRRTRRALLGRTSVSLGAAALTALLEAEARPARAGEEERRPTNPLPGFPHFPPRAKRVIFLYMSGGPSHLETFDYKPRLAELDGQPMPQSVTRGQPIAQL